jgi:hypothetical protein
MFHDNITHRYIDIVHASLGIYTWISEVNLWIRIVWFVYILGKNIDATGKPWNVHRPLPHHTTLTHMYTPHEDVS